jgi:hypothetical protein
MMCTTVDRALDSVDVAHGAISASRLWINLIIKHDHRTPSDAAQEW